MALFAADIRDPEISSLVAAKLREFHNLDMPGPKNVLLWERLRTWLSHAKKICSLRTAKEFSLDILGEEISILEKELTQGCQDIGFCHNDLQYGNIMMDEETRAITLIMRYGGAPKIHLCLSGIFWFVPITANFWLDCMHAGNELIDAKVEQLLIDAEKYTLANRLFWGLWGIISVGSCKQDRLRLVGVCAAEDSTILVNKSLALGFLTL
ncbi:Kinase superfamily protein isoform 4 [Hibiscus syriacus]|uniref:Kinase superfamily protein isoform 4 n=1 Tax=Hibiscus syriacus TaxID=106335 RepID=A0A6A2YY71_HIBSY|nr:Kinase superfamily protein isoform 4 [Hibiscus syriacus]